MNDGPFKLNPDVALSQRVEFIKQSRADLERLRGLLGDARVHVIKTRSLIAESWAMLARMSH